MSQQPSTPGPAAVSVYVEDGARIAAILLVWGVLAAFFTYGVAELGGVGSIFETIGPRLGELAVTTGLLNAVLYVLYRVVDYHHAQY